MKSFLSSDVLIALLACLNTAGLAYIAYLGSRRHAETKQEISKVLQVVNGPLTHALKTVEILTAEKAAKTGTIGDIKVAEAATAVRQNQEDGKAPTT